MSRLIVKNLPKKISDSKLRESFSCQGGHVTDVQLKYTKDGVFRHFGFVGFSSEEEAERAKQYLDGTFIGACRIKVDVCAELGSKDKPRAWSKYAADSSNYKNHKEEKNDDEKKERKAVSKKEKQKKVDALLEKYKDDAKFQEFLRVHKRNFAEGVWSNDAILNVGRDYEDQIDVDSQAQGKPNEEGSEEEASDSSEDEESVERPSDKATDRAVSDLDYLKSKKVSEQKESSKKTSKTPKNETFFTVKISGLPCKTKKKDIKGLMKPLKAKSIRVPRKIKGIAYVGFADEKEQKKALAKNKTFISGHQITIRPYIRTETSHDSNVSKWQEQEEELKTVESVAESGRIFIRNLSYEVTEDDLEKLFSPFGPIAEMHLPVDNITKTIKGFAFVTFVMPEDAVRAFADLDGTIYRGRLLHLIPSKAKLSENEDVSMEGMSYKKKKALKEKAEAGSSHNWNTLFLGASAVADLMSEKYNVSKSQILTDNSGKQTAAVKLALGETQIVNETRQFLEDNGIHLDAFSRPTTARSKTVILVKNLPAKTPVEEIRDKFASFGELGRVVLPPYGITAIVEFIEASEAKKALKSLAYTKFHNTPLYLEWAPDNALSEKSPSKKESLEDAKGDSNNNAGKSQTSSHATAGSTLFVKNISFDTTDAGLLEHFKKAGFNVVTASISKKKDLKRPGEMLSMGYGFVEFSGPQEADKALKTQQHKMLDGHCLELKRSNRASLAAGTENSTQRKLVDHDKAVGSKILVRNIPFEAKAKEVEDIFKTFGILKSVRLPKKVTGSHRGFAFVEFSTKEEAKKAFQALCHSTHLYGRRLVLEWAEQEETIEDLRKRTASHFVASSGAASKKKRVKKSDIMESVVLESKN